MQAHTAAGPTPKDLGERVDTLGWGVLFVAIGAVSLMPSPEGSWMVAAGIVMLGMSAVRARLGLPVWGVTVVIGIVAVAAGVLTIAGLTVWVGPLVLIVLGTALICGAAYRRPHRPDSEPTAQSYQEFDR